MIDDARGSVRALLGPTNTGKTHRAVERMLEHRSGMIGLPLRLLAREVYDRMTAQVGEEAVALITGEEKRVPARPRYWVCTVESMPVEREVDFIVVDEIQLAAHRQRGHVFTDRLLRSRGAVETWFLGASTVAPLIRELLPKVRIESRPRLSELRYAGDAALTSLPRRSAVVAFSAERVYELAERLRRRRGGAAVVLGALSPRTRNAQVAMYQAGEVDYLVATDAIGMGLNMDVEHVAFAALDKFDGREVRPLERDELAQIAGRAGRYRSDGTFGAISEVGPLPASLVSAIERHAFAPLSHLIWRNSDLDLRSTGHLIESLRVRSPRPELRRVERADDFDALTQLASSPEIRDRARGRGMTALLWDVCRIPDFRRLMLDSHVRLLARIFVQLSGPTGRLDVDWMAQRIARLDDPDGDIATLMGRIAFIRTWTYIANHAEWVVDARHWQERTSAIENDLSDALHERLTERFVSRRERTRVIPAAARPVDEANPFRRLLGLELPAGPQGEGSAEGEAEAADAWVERFVEAEHRAIEGRGSEVFFGERRVAHLRRGPDLLHPEVVLSVDEELGAGARARIHRRLIAWSRDEVAALLGPLSAEPLSSASPALRGLHYQLVRDLGCIAADAGSAQLGSLRAGERGLLRELGVVVGRRSIYLRGALTPALIGRRLALVQAFFGALAPELAEPGAPSTPVDRSLDPSRYLLVGYGVAGPRALRVDVLEDCLAELHRLHQRLDDPREGSIVLPEGFAARLGAIGDELELEEVAVALGFRPLGGGRYRLSAPRRHRRGRRRRR